MKKLLVMGKSFVQKHKRVMAFAMAIMCLACMLAVSASAEATVETVEWSDFSGVLSNLTAQISVANILAIVAALVGVSVGLAFMWWAVRKLIRVIMAAFKKGKVSV